MPKNTDTEIKSDAQLVLRDAELTQAMIDAKQGDDPEAARAAKDELRAFRQHWRGIREFIAITNAGTAYPDAIEATAKGN